MKYLILTLCYISYIFGAEIQEEPFLRHIQQVTFPEDGFEKAGESYFSPDGNSLIFQAVPTGKKEYQIYTLNLQTRALSQVSTGKGKCTCGFFHPLEDKILFASSHESPLLNEPQTQEPSNRYVWELTPYMQIYEALLDGSQLKALTKGPFYHAECGYSSDGKRVVYASNESGSMNIYIYNTLDGFTKQVTDTTYSYNGGPFFSPDDQFIVFRSDRDEPDQLQLFLIRTDGTQERQLTHNEYVNWAPFWHPSGKHIAYTTSKHGHHAYQIYLMDSETGKQQRVTHSSTFEGLPSFSKDGKKMTWTSKRGDGTPQVFIADFVIDCFQDED